MAQRKTRAHKIREKHWPEIERAYFAGMPYTQIADQINVAPTTLAKWLREEGLRHKGTRGRYPKAMHGKARELYKKGWKVEQLVHLLNVPEERVEIWLKTKPSSEPEKRRVKNPAPKNTKLSRRAQRLLSDPPVPRHKPNSAWTKKEKKYVEGLIKKGMTVLEIYRVAGASKARQSRIWKEMGHKGPPPNFPSQEDKKKVGKKRKRARVKEAKKEQVSQLREELAETQLQLEQERKRTRKRALARRRREAEAAGEVRVSQIVDSPEELAAAESAVPLPEPPRGLPPGRQTPLPRRRPRGRGGE